MAVSSDPIYQQHLEAIRADRGFTGSNAQLQSLLNKEAAAAQRESAEQIRAGREWIAQGNSSQPSVGPSPEKPSDQANTNTSRAKPQLNEKSLRYPLKQIEKTTDFLEIQIKKYQAPGIKSQSITAQPSSTEVINKQQILKTIFLPIPQNIQDNNSVGWGDDSLNSLAAYAVGASKSVIDSPDYIKGILSTFKSAAGEASKFIDAGGQDLASSFFASKAVNLLGANTSLEGILARSSGQILNPNMELLFQSVKLRSFNFEFDLAPRSADESMIIKKIIRELKINMAARSSEGRGKGIFLRSPNVFQLVYRKGSGDHPFLNKFKPMALQNMVVNYTGSGTYSTYDDATPVHMKLSLSFQELNPIYAEDYGDSDVGVGY